MQIGWVFIVHAGHQMAFILFYAINYAWKRGKKVRTHNGNASAKSVDTLQNQSHSNWHLLHGSSGHTQWVIVLCETHGCPKPLCIIHIAEGIRNVPAKLCVFISYIYWDRHVYTDMTKSKNMIFITRLLILVKGVLGPFSLLDAYVQLIQQYHCQTHTQW